MVENTFYQEYSPLAKQFDHNMQLLRDNFMFIASKMSSEALQYSIEDSKTTKWDTKWIEAAMYTLIERIILEDRTDNFLSKTQL